VGGERAFSPKNGETVEEGPEKGAWTEGYSAVGKRKRRHLVFWGNHKLREFRLEGGDKTEMLV